MFIRTQLIYTHNVYNLQMYIFSLNNINREDFDADDDGEFMLRIIKMKT